MPNTRSSTLSIRLKPETKKRLAKLAQTSGRSSNFLIADAVGSSSALSGMERSGKNGEGSLCLYALKDLQPKIPCKKAPCFVLISLPPNWPNPGKLDPGKLRTRYVLDLASLE